MTGPDRVRIKQVLEAALALPPSARDRCLAESCAGDRELEAEVRTLLRLYDRHVPSPDSAAYSSPTTFAGTALSPVSPVEPESPAIASVAGPKRWGSYVLVEELGRGGFGVVYRAWDPALRRDVAIKIVDARRLAGLNTDAALREGQLIARVRHENVVTVHGVQPHDGELGLVMEYIKGRTLAQIVASDGPLSAHEAALVGLKLCDALTAVHRLGLVHRDLKASNVMRESGGRIVLMDFGAGRELAAEGAARHEILGTPAYMPPEVLLGSRGTALSDIYSLGVLLYFLVTGTYPVRASGVNEMRLAHIGGERQSLAERRSDLPERFIAAVEKALSPEPAGRFASALLFKRDLLDALPTLPRPPHARIRRSPAAAVAEPAAPTPMPQAALLPSPALHHASVIQRAARLAVMCAGAVVLTGFLAGLEFNAVLGRSGRFVSDGFITTLIWGARALIGPLGWFVIAMFLLNVAGFAWRMLTRVFPRAGDPFRAVARGAQQLTGTLGIADATSRVQLLSIAGALALLTLLVAFRGFIAAFVASIDDAPAGTFRMLSADHYAARLWFRRLLELFILAMSFALYRLGRGTGATVRPPARVLVGAAALVIFAALLLVAPYRVMFKSQFEGVLFGGRQCYAIGESGSEVLLHCPDAEPPRNRIVQRSDPRVTWSGRESDLFDAYAGAPNRR